MRRRTGGLPACRVAGRPAACQSGPRGRRRIRLVLDADECYRLLATQQIGRLGVNAEHYPLIFPVNYAIDRDVIVIRTGEGTMLSAADHANVTFEVDEIDPRTRSGWSVLVRGLAEEMVSEHGAEMIGRTKAAGAEPWAPGTAVGGSG